MEAEIEQQRIFLLDNNEKGRKEEEKGYKRAAEATKVEEQIKRMIYPKLDTRISSVRSSVRTPFVTLRGHPPDFLTIFDNFLIFGVF